MHGLLSACSDHTFAKKDNSSLTLGRLSSYLHCLLEIRFTGLAITSRTCYLLGMAKSIPLFIKCILPVRHIVS